MSRPINDRHVRQQAKKAAGYSASPSQDVAEALAAERQGYEAFLHHFSRAQPQVQTYIRSLVHDRAAADDVFQATSLALWRKFSTFSAEADFVSWALGVARKEVLLYWRSRRRDRLVFSEEVLAQLADVALAVAHDPDPRQQALEACLEKLPERQQQLVDLFYRQRLPADTIATSWSRTVHAVYKALKVMRRNLVDCIDRTLAGNS